MMKRVFAFLLLYLCCNIGLSTNVNQEIAKKLSKLHSLYNHKKVNITRPDMVRIPKRTMSTNAPSCVGVFTKELTYLLNNVTVLEKENKDLPIELQANLQRLEELRLQEPQQQNDYMCQMVPAQNPSMVFHQYLYFARKLNNSKKK